MKPIKITEKQLNLLLVAFLAVLGAWLMALFPYQSIGQVYYNNTTTVDTRVNITNAAPIVTSITLDSPIDLNGYGYKQVYCNVTVFDYDNDSVTVNATLYLEGVAEAGDGDDFNNHYTNSSCTNLTAQNPYMNYSCVFDVLYNADNSSNWRCNATTKDQGAYATSNISDYATGNPLVAVYVPSLIDYGNLVTGQTSDDVEANITNAGNRDINVSVKGWGNVEGDNLAFVCDSGTIALSYERYNITDNSNYAQMTQVTTNNVRIGDSNWWIPQRTSESLESKNATYWKLFVPAGAGGLCNGKLMFTAFDRQSN